jgi:DNA-binding transcriptional MerR regulator
MEKPLPSPKPPELLPVPKFLDEAGILPEWQQANNPLHRLMEWAARELDRQALSYLEVTRLARNVTRESFWDNEKVTGGLRMLREQPERVANFPRGIMNYIRAYPALLLLPEGKVLLRGLVDVLEEARFGTSRRRVRALMPEGSRKARAKAAQDALAWLARGNRGEKLDYRLDEIMMYLKLRVTQLQAEYKATVNMPTTAMRREKLRKDHREELEKLTERELQNLFNDESVKVAARLAEKATGLSEETFLRAQRDYERCWAAEKQRKAEADRIVAESFRRRLGKSAPKSKDCAS